MLQPWGMQSSLSLSSHLGPLWPGIIAEDWVISMDQIELNSVTTLN